MIRLLPEIHLPGWLWSWAGVIAVIRIGNILWGYVSGKQFLALHTMMNKVTGVALFLFPLTLSFLEPQYTAIVVWAIATYAAITEGFYVISVGR